MSNTSNKAFSKRHKPSTQLWLRRQWKDPYVKEAKRLGYRSRSAFKLLEINEKHPLFRGNPHVLDLGCAPGGWCQVVRSILGERGKIFGIDRLFMEPVEGVTFSQSDIFETFPFREKFHVILSDMSPSSTGHRATDLLQMEALMKEVWHIAIDHLLPGGALVVKSYGQHSLIHPFKASFNGVHYMKPSSSRKESKEIYWIGKGWNPSPGIDIS